MGSKEIILFLMVSFQLYNPVSLFPLGENLPSARSLENVGDKEVDEHISSTHDGGNEIGHRNNFAYGVVGGKGGSGGRPVSNGEEGNGGGSTTPNTVAGTAVIPLYAAGAANNHHNHRGAGSCNRSCIELPTWCAVMLASLLVHIYVVLGIESLIKPA